MQNIEPLALDIPYFYEGLYDYDIDPPKTLGQAIDNLTHLVDAIRQATVTMRSDNFDPYSCDNTLDWFYYDNDTLDMHDIYPSKNVNYYYVTAVPELLNVEYALERLDDDGAVDVSSARQAANKLKSELWQLLPDFYRGHTDPHLQPITYNAGTPYPHNSALGKLEFERRLRHWMKKSAMRDHDLVKPHIPDDNSPVVEVTRHNGGYYFEFGDASRLGGIYSDDVNPFEHIILFAEDLISASDPTFLMNDPEGPATHYLTYAAKSKSNVKIIAYGEDHDYSVKPTKHTPWEFSAVVNRRQFIRVLLESYHESAKQDLEIAKKNQANIGHHEWSIQEAKDFIAATNRLNEMI